MLQIINPATGEFLQSLVLDTTESISKKFEITSAEQKKWATESIANRLQIVYKFAKLLQEQIEPLALVLTQEVGKPIAQSRNEIKGAIARIDWFAAHAEKNLADEIMSESDSMKEIIKYEPLGVIGNISAWNYPYLVGVNVFVPALLAGNAVLYKPSEFASLTGMEIDRIWKEAGLPKNIFQIITGAREAGETLLHLPLDGYFFTGSYNTGKYIYEKVASKMVPCQLELGGKDPLYITEDIADIQKVAQGTADGAFYNNGQSCCAVERIYVHEAVFADYVKYFVEEVRSWKMGLPTEEGVYIGALTRFAQIEFLEKQVKDALTKGATLLTGGKKMEGIGNYFEPTVLIDVTHDMHLMQEESFGPIIGIMKVKNEEEAIEKMNDTQYGLTASVYSTNKKKADQILAKVNSGTSYWNCCDRVSAALPWSGRKHSGFGSTLSNAGIRAFTKPKAYHLRG